MWHVALYGCSGEHIEQSRYQISLLESSLVVSDSPSAPVLLQHQQCPILIRAGLSAYYQAQNTVRGYQAEFGTDSSKIWVLRLVVSHRQVHCEYTQALTRVRFTWRWLHPIPGGFTLSQSFIWQPPCQPRQGMLESKLIQQRQHLVQIRG